MSRNHHVIDAGVDRVWEVLSDGWLYPLWVVGASRMREVDGHWPDQGARLHHSAGVWPMVIDDTTEVLECEPGSRLVLQARAWPGGEATVVIELRPRDAGHTEVVIEEQATSGPGSLVPRFLQDPPLAWRNVETLRRLALIVENRTGTSSS